MIPCRFYSELNWSQCENQSALAGQHLWVYISDQIAWHGDNVEAVRSVLGQMLVDNFLLPKAADLDADMIVMGPYGRSCVREFIVGVASCDILECMTVLVFM